MSDDTNIDKERRQFLTGGVSVVGGVGMAAAVWPFLSSMSPSARSKAIGVPVKISLKKLGQGEILREKWRGRPVWVVRRSKEMLDALEANVTDLRDPESQNSVQPEYAQNSYRSTKPEYLVLVGICTHLGCSPTFRPDQSPEDLGESWKGGFFCACHGSRFDLAGRVYKNVPASKNLVVPPYRFTSDDAIIIGETEDV